MAAPERVLGTLEAHQRQTIDELVALARIPSVSAPGFEPAEVVRSAEAVADLLRNVGLDAVDVVSLAGCHPYVLGEWMGAGPEAPTALLYAHHDVQPPGRLGRWQSPAFEPTERADGRLYGRGVVDDKAGVLVFAAAIRAWMKTEGRLPLNVRLIVEGEEETGSEHLAEFLSRHRERVDADVIVLSDTANLDTGIPSITTSLRGLVAVDVCVRALDHPLHSGMWGGPVPDAATALGVLLGRLIDARGEVAIAGFHDDVPELSAADRERISGLPFDAAAFRADAGLALGSSFAGEADRIVYERLWSRPALAVTALEGMPLADAANQLIAEARARIGVRIAPGQSAERVRDLLVEFLERDPPWGVGVETRVNCAVPGWRTEPVGPAFDAARRALHAGYGCAPVDVGCGGSIPFVAPFAEVLGGVPALLLGLEDPVCNAHGENESLHLGDFAKATRAATHLLSELAGLPRLQS